ncbi:nucleotide exchange factor GrpE [Microbacterium sp. Marseille-Q6965]|uniref:nucleotide exchange factor GrpE n=1 Tax=Microbacterium sp. Marseille-Q6965 TaxID=2965072 RepID=UPI0021B83A50|nr:nucleotide exchange factor GrpE [Microbacterium sp. Marseille-Q6965]
MADKDFDENDEVQPGAEGPEASASGPDAQADQNAQAGEPTPDEALTVDDILGAEQTDEAAEAEHSDYETQLLHDLKRLQAEYANYRRRTEEQRQLEIDRAKGSVAKSLLPVLDDLDRAAKHGDLEEGSAFAIVAEKMRGVAERLGLVTYGAAGDVFDPQQHEAVFQQPTPGATESTVLEVVEVGYRLGDVELRPAKVVVAVPAE